MAAVRVVYVVEGESYDPATTLASKSWKNASEMVVISSELALVHTVRAS